MSKIRIKNFGPIEEGMPDDGWIDIKKVTVFIGNQGSGKSVIAKLISTFSWIEKVLTRGDYDIKHFEKSFTKKDQSSNQYLAYHRIENYFSKPDKTLIDYTGDSYHIIYECGNFRITDAKNGDYPLPQIMYVPADRNFISNVRTPKALKQISPSLSELVTEQINAGLAMKEPLLLPVNEKTYVEYNKLNDIFYIKGKDYRIKLTEASSGFQSLVPLFLTSWFLSDSVKKQGEHTKERMTSEQRERFRIRVKEINDNPDLTDELRRIALSELGKEFTKTAFINIVEEPEQNLFPASQQQMLNCLLGFNNMSKGNKLILTTHSPYLINYLTLAIQADYLLNKINSSSDNLNDTSVKYNLGGTTLKKQLNKIVPIDSVVSANNVAIYELDEKKGIVKRLETYEGIPSDKNFLNRSLADGNKFFDALLEIEEEL